VTPETALKNQINNYLKSLGRDIWFFKVHGSSAQKAGVPDTVGCINGRFFGMEAKAGNNQPSLKQDREINLIRLAGGSAGVVWSLDEAKRFIEEAASA
jgi:hypothetical protein